MLMDKLFAVLSVISNIQSIQIAQKTMKGANLLHSDLEGCSLDQRMAHIFFGKESDNNDLCHLFILVLFCLKTF